MKSYNCFFTAMILGLSVFSSFAFQVRNLYHKTLTIEWSRHRGDLPFPVPVDTGGTITVEPGKIVKVKQTGPSRFKVTIKYEMDGKKYGIMFLPIHAKLVITPTGRWNY